MPSGPPTQVPLRRTPSLHTPRPPRTRHIQLPSARLHLLDWRGEGAPLLLLPGLGHSAHVFATLARELGPGLRPIALTPRAHGESSTPPDGYSLDQLAADALGVLDALRLERVIIAAHSLGGAVASRMAAAAPERVSALVYLDSLADYAGIGRMRARCPVRPPLLPAGASDALERAWTERYLYGRWDAALAADWQARGDAVLHARRRDLLVELLDDALSSLEPFAALRCPILALMALESVESEYPWLPAGHPLREDAEVYLRTVRAPWRQAAADRLLRACPWARVSRIPGNHYFFLSDPAGTAAAIKAFLAGAGVGR
jgi:pimeloyl-ACP methyl ester carboxylesterase